MADQDNSAAPHKPSASEILRDAVSGDEQLTAIEEALSDLTSHANRRVDKLKALFKKAANG